MLERLPGEFQREPLLWVDHLDLARAHLEEVGVERAHVVEVAALGVRRLEDLGETRIGGELGPPALGQVGDAVDAADERLPGRLRGGAGLGETRRQADDRDVVVGAALTLPEGVDCVGEAFVGVAVDDALRQRRDRRVVVDHGRGQDDPGLVLDVGGERHGIARGESEFFHRAVDVDLGDRHGRRLRHPFTQPVPQLVDGEVTGGLTGGGLGAGGCSARVGGCSVYRTGGLEGRIVGQIGAA